MSLFSVITGAGVFLADRKMKFDSLKRRTFRIVFLALVIVIANPNSQAQQNPYLPEGLKTIIEMGGDFTGPVPAIKEFFGRMPIFGGGAGIVDTYRTYIPLTSGFFVAELLANPRFAEGERRYFKKYFVIRPRIWDNEVSFRERVIDIDRTLEGCQREAEQFMTHANSREKRQRELYTIQAIIAFRARLMPPRMETNEQAEKFVAQNPPGTLFTAKDKSGHWMVYRIPKRQSNKEQELAPQEAQ